MNAVCPLPMTAKYASGNAATIAARRQSSQVRYARPSAEATRTGPPTPYHSENVNC